AHVAARRPTVDGPAVGARTVFVFRRDMRDAIAPLARRHARGEVVAVKRRVRVRADQSEFNFHGANLSGIRGRGKLTALLHTSLQATSCRGFFASNTGSIVLQRSTRMGQRGSRRQPGGGFTGSCSSPLSGERMLSISAATVGFAASSAFV